MIIYVHTISVNPLFAAVMWLPPDPTAAEQNKSTAAQSFWTLGDKTYRHLEEKSAPPRSSGRRGGSTRTPGPRIHAQPTWWDEEEAADRRETGNKVVRLRRVQPKGGPRVQEGWRHRLLTPPSPLGYRENIAALPPSDWKMCGIVRSIPRNFFYERC